ncbi:CHAT domain-containing protein [Streptomyces sp. NPDC059970]|uniref:CHAT domain-containing protein n=1 Tax=Streptomyces sp. NPDC059970 TaxID=3347019 RepID=UPI00368B6DA8
MPHGNAHLVAVVSAHGNTGRTTTIAGLGAALASERNDRIIAVDANDGMLGRYALAPNTGLTLRDLAVRLGEDIFDLRGFTSRAAFGLEILADAAGTTAPSEPLDAVSYSALLTALDSYGVVLSDCATGVDGLTAFVALTGADQQIFVSSLSHSSVTATAEALATYRYLANRTHVVLTGVRDSGTMLNAREAAERLGADCRSVVVVPFDERLADGDHVDPGRMQDATQEAYRELAAVVAEGFSQTKHRGAGEPSADPHPLSDGPRAEPLSHPPNWGEKPQPPRLPSRGSLADGRRGHEEPDRTTRMPGADDRRGPVASDAVRPGSFEYPKPAAEFARPSYMDPASTASFARPDFGAPDGQGDPSSTGTFDQEHQEPRESPGDGRTPLYDALETHWFQAPREQQSGNSSAPAPQEPQPPPTPPQPPAMPAWRSSPNDDLIRHAERRRQPPAGGATTPLPRRFRQANLDPGTAQQQQQSGPQVSRLPEDVRGRLTNLRRGFRRGRQAGPGASDQDGRLVEAGQSGDDGVLDSAGSGSWSPGGRDTSGIGSGSSQGSEATGGGQTSEPGPGDDSPYSGPPEPVARLYEDQQWLPPAMTQPMAPIRPQVPSPMWQAPSPTRGFLMEEDDDVVGSTGSSQDGEFALGPATAQASPRAESPAAAPTGGVGGLSEPHHLIAELAEQAAPDREVPLHVQITREPGPGQGSVRMRSFLVPEEGAQLTITVTAQGMRALGDLTQELTVYPGRDSDVLYFGLRTMAPGLHHVTVRAFHKGTYLGALHLQISVTEGGVTRDGPRRRAVLPGIAFEPGEATLQVHRAEDGSFSFQLLSETCYPPELFRYRGGDPGEATEQIYAQLREAASRAGRASPADAAALQKRLKNEGVQLWSSAVPEAVQRQFWEQADRITSFTVLGEHDFVPWELLYPLDKDHDNGFLAEWLPVVRRVFRQDRVHRIALPGAAFVMPPGSPEEAALEIAELRKLLGPGGASAKVLTEREALTDLIERGHAGLLHFACHNAFSRSGSRVHMTDGHFTPRDLATAAQTGSLRGHQPLVFFNACRSAGEIPWFSDTLGWAQNFLKAGAGAFIGTLWPVRSDSAMQFAKTFYGELLDGGQSLGQASLAARQAIRDLGGDPTWLAYAVYGSPAATATTRGHS